MLVTNNTMRRFLSKDAYNPEGQTQAVMKAKLIRVRQHTEESTQDQNFSLDVVWPIRMSRISSSLLNGNSRSMYGMK